MSNALVAFLVSLCKSSLKIFNSIDVASYIWVFYSHSFFSLYEKILPTPLLLFVASANTRYREHCLRVAATTDKGMVTSVYTNTLQYSDDTVEELCLMR